MRLCAALFILPLTPVLIAQSPLARQLDGVARIASVMVDGDVARQIQTPRSLASMLHNTSPDPWAASDNYDVDHQPFLSTKKTLMRLARLCDDPCDVNLWIPIPSKPPRIQILIRNVHEMSQFWPWGALDQPMPDEMKQVLDKGKRVVVSKKAEMTSVLAPVYNSLGDIVALVEVAGRSKPDPQENVQ